LDKFRQAFVMGLIVGIVTIFLGIALIVNYSIYFYNVPASRSSIVYLLGGVVCIFVGSMFIAKSIPVFIPIKQQPCVAMHCCPYCGAIVDEDAVVCQKGKQQLD
jgi:hypothetical protein